MSNVLNQPKAIQMHPSFEIYTIYIMEQMDMNLMEFRRNGEMDDDFNNKLRNFFVEYLKTTQKFSIVHGDIKPRLELKKLLA